ncbi:MAG: helix-turn-helix domain-containing protein [Luteolibacter sp.]
MVIFGALKSERQKLRRNTVGPNVRAIRQDLGITQSNLAAKCNLVGFDVGRESISQIERQVRGVSDIEMILIARALKVSLDELVPEKIVEWQKDTRSPLGRE